METAQRPDPVIPTKEESGLVAGSSGPETLHHRGPELFCFCDIRQANRPLEYVLPGGSRCGERRGG
ncbi:MAG TPA: hypothetical protein VFQ80_14805, partial [Thermomicrobiales bacterium]|nr:hypothetical protein [Thermomicrobiales bacterium]